MAGKEEIAEKGYMRGDYIEGQGKAHNCCRPHIAALGFPVFGTFNIKLKTGRLNEFTPSIVTRKANYYFLKLKTGKFERFGWAIRDHKSNQGLATLEVLTKELLPHVFKDSPIAVTLYELWSEECTNEWAEDKYWFQTFPFSPKKRADSQFVWNVIDKIDWAKMSVLDIGAHYGFMSFKASEAGAVVVGFEPNKKSIKMATIIRNNIIQQDVRFMRGDDGSKYDVILYLSVHHQSDPSYAKLARKIRELKHRARKHLFVELILPPMFPKDSQMTEAKIDETVGGKILARYEHNVRGTRKIYWIKK